MKYLFLILGLISILFVSCSESDDNIELIDSECDQIAILDNERFQNSKSEGFSIQSVQVNGDCLEVKLQSSGCSGDSWKAELIDAEWIAESLPIQRDVKILLDNKELCNAIFTRTYTFDLRPLRIKNNDKLFLDLEHWDELILYEY